jgi:hypothetical protein
MALPGAAPNRARRRKSPAELPRIIREDMPRAASTPSLRMLHTRAAEVTGFSLLMWVIAAIIVAIGLALRIIAAHGDLWIDEIWTLNLARAVSSPAGIFRERIDNNHLLNTLYLYAVGDQRDFWVFRIHSIIAGTAGIALAGALVRRCAGNAGAMLAMALVAGSYVMINYGSEARGYAVQVMFFLGALLTIHHGLLRRSWIWPLVFWLCCALGLLAHVLFLQGYAALLAWSAWRLWNTDITWPRRLCIAAMYHIVPITMSGVLYLAFIRHLEIAGASTSDSWNMILESAAFALGLPRTGAWDFAALLAVIVIVLAGVIILATRHCDLWVFFIVATFIAPVAIAWASGAEFLLPRYFLIPITCVLLLLAVVLAACWQRGVTGRIVAGIVIAGFLAGNFIDARKLLIHGRGQYLDALRYIYDHSPGSAVRICGDHDKRQRTIVNFYKRYLPSDKQVGYVDNDKVDAYPPQWMLVHRWVDGASPQPPPPEVFTVHLAIPMTFERAASFEASPLGGWRCFVYRRVGP